MAVFSKGAKRVVLLTLGWEDLPKSWSVHQASEGERLREPVPAVLVEVDSGWVLLDTGFNPALIRDPALHERFHGRFFGIEPVLGPGDDPLLEALDRSGVSLETIACVAVSHLHNDHAGGLRHFCKGTPVHAQRQEVLYGLNSPDAEANGIYRIDFDDGRIEWVLANGDVEIAPGVTAVSTPGHTPGHQSFVVRFADSVGGGGFVFAADAADLIENFEHDLPIGGTIGVAPDETIGNIIRLKALAEEMQLLAVPGHDPFFWPALTSELLSGGGRIGPQGLLSLRTRMSKECGHCRSDRTHEVITANSKVAEG